MPRPVQLRLRDRTIWLVPSQDVESWASEVAERRIREAAGPAEDLGDAIAFLAARYW